VGIRREADAAQAGQPRQAVVRRERCRCHVEGFRPRSALRGRQVVADEAIDGVVTLRSPEAAPEAQRQSGRMAAEPPDIGLRGQISGDKD
ncbi:MAG TPA: hypothetical protein VGC92_01975, partial [Phenylobacterium sp.]